jgi:ADP-heptose:LPS heptosyltransferase/glycosyltransferase involved in cell wall biosynthesis/predicted SAM-dependent methyltransferase
MTVNHQPNLLQHAQELIKTGDNKQAMVCMQEYLRTNPNDAQAMNDAGAILYVMGHFDEAESYLKKARSAAGDCPEILWNLAELYLATGSIAEITQLLDSMERQGILNPDIINRTATAMLDQNEKGEALEMLLRSLTLSANQEVLKPMLEVIRSKRQKVAFFCGGNDVKFLTDIHQFTKERFPVEVFTGKTASEMYELMKWSDISWFEWCTDLAIEASKLPKVCRNIVRLHRWEAYSDFPQSVHWNNVDVLITVGNSFVAKALRKQVPNLDTVTRVITIPNGVDLEKFNFFNRTRGKNIACVGYLNMRKNPMFLLQCIQKLHYIDSEYRLFFAGNFQDTMLEQYIRHMVDEMGLSEVVVFDGWQGDISAWLEDKHFIVSASIGESQGMGLLEGMARGLKPVIHHFPGANEIFPSECLFTIAEEFCRQILSDSYDPQRYKEFVAARYPLKDQLKSINKIFTFFENTPLRNNRETDLCRERLLPYCSGKGLDIGCGDNKIDPEAIGVDIEGSPDIKADARQLPFENGSMDYVFSSHCLEDLDDTGAAFAEWMRVLRIGGNLALYLPHKNYYPRVGTPGANPHHKHDLDLNTVLAALSETNEYEIVHLDEAGTGGEHSFAMVVRKLAPKQAKQKVLVEYDAVVGDIMCIEPAIRSLKNKLGGDTAITVRVTHPELFRNHPCVSKVEHTHFPRRYNDYQQHLQFNWMPTDDNRMMSLVERSASQIAVALEKDRCPKIYLDHWDEVMLEKYHLPKAGGPKIAIGVGARWPSRCWSRDKWLLLCQQLEKQLKAQIIQLGGESDEFFGYGLDLIGQTSPREAAAVLSRCDLAITVDSGLAHLAAAVGAPRVVLFGPVLPETRMHTGIGRAVVATESDCRGCFHTTGLNVSVCPKGHNNCMERISIENVFNAVEQCLSEAKKHS